MKYRIKRKNYRKFMDSCVDKLYKGIMTMDEYRNMEIEFEPIDFSLYPHITEKTQEMIEKLFTEEDTDRNGNYMLRGFTYHPYNEKVWLNMVLGDGGNSYSWWAFNNAEMLIYTYCEGDTTITLCKTREAYETEKERSKEFYKEV